MDFDTEIWDEVFPYTDYSESQISLTKTRLLLAKPRWLNLGLITKLLKNWPGPAHFWIEKDQSACWKRVREGDWLILEIFDAPALICFEPRQSVN